MYTPAKFLTTFSSNGLGLGFGIPKEHTNLGCGARTTPRKFGKHLKIGIFFEENTSKSAYVSRKTPQNRHIFRGNHRFPPRGSRGPRGPGPRGPGPGPRAYGISWGSMGRAPGVHGIPFGSHGARGARVPDPPAKGPGPWARARGPRARAPDPPAKGP